MRSTALFLACMISSAPALAAAEPNDQKADAKSGAKVLVLPYQAIYRTVAQPKLDAATQLLFKELEQKQAMTITRGAVSGADAKEAPKGPSLDAANTAVQAATKAEEGRRIAEAIAEWKKAISIYESNAAGLDSVDAYLMAHHRLARAIMMSGNDKEAKAAIDQAARLSPSFAVSPKEFSRLYRRWFTEAAEAAGKEAPGSIVVISPLPGAVVLLDGREMEVAPVQLEKVVPGKHLIVARVAGGPSFSTVVTVAPKQKAEVRAVFSSTAGGSAVGKVTDAIAENAIPKPAVEAAAQAGKDVGAEFVIFGGMAKDEDKFRVHTYVVDAKTQKIAPLDKVTFDLELLTAETDVLRIAKAAHEVIGKFPAQATNQVGPIEKGLKATSNLTKVDASPDVVASNKPVQPAKKPAEGGREVFKPLKTGTVEIKDEKE